MEIVEQSHKILPHGTIESVELAGRTAYKSEDKITSDSAAKFIKAVMQRGHESVIEHYPLAMRIDNNEPDHLLWQIREIEEETIGFHHTITDRFIVVSMNARTLRDAKRRVNNELTDLMIKHAGTKAPILFDDLGIQFERVPLMHSVTEKELLQNLKPVEAAKHIYRMVKFITDRGVTHELVRHRIPAYTQESTRYCNYAKKGVVFVEPVFWQEATINNRDNYDAWMDYLLMCEKVYVEMINRGAKPQEARLVLPNCLKTEIVVTTNVREWRHIFKLRTAPDAHPQIRGLMIPCLHEMQEQVPALLSDVWEKSVDHELDEAG